MYQQNYEKYQESIKKITWLYLIFELYLQIQVPTQNHPLPLRYRRSIFQTVQNCSLVLRRLQNKNDRLYEIIVCKI